MASGREQGHGVRHMSGLGREDLRQEQIGEVLTWMARRSGVLAGPLVQ